MQLKLFDINEDIFLTSFVTVFEEIPPTMIIIWKKWKNSFSDSWVTSNGQKIKEINMERIICQRFEKMRPYGYGVQIEINLALIVSLKNTNID